MLNTILQKLWEKATKSSIFTVSSHHCTLREPEGVALPCPRQRTVDRRWKTKLLLHVILKQQLTNPFDCTVTCTGEIYSSFYSHSAAWTSVLELSNLDRDDWAGKLTEALWHREIGRNSLHTRHSRCQHGRKREILTAHSILVILDLSLCNITQFLSWNGETVGSNHHCATVMRST